MNTQELTTAVRGIEKTVSTHEECIKDHERQINDMKVEVKEQGRLLQSIDKLAMGLSRLDEKMGDLACKIDNFGSRINLIELKPAEKWERMVYKVLEYVVLAGLGFLAAKLIGGV